MIDDFVIFRIKVTEYLVVVCCNASTVLILDYVGFIYIPSVGPDKLIFKRSLRLHKGKLCKIVTDK